jgi:ABC-2 type transport system ATP-binding protein
VEAICRRVLIINGGKIVASDTPENLRRRLEGAARVVAEISGPADAVSEKLRGLPAVQRVESSGAGDWLRFELQCARDADPRAAIFEAVVQNGWKLRSLNLERQSLEDVFVSLTRSDGRGTRA